MSSSILRSLSILSVVFMISGCSLFSGSLRKDFNDSQANAEPRKGGLFPERNLLDADDPGSMEPSAYGHVGHSDRSPASYEPVARGRSSWVSGEQMAARRRDEMRGARDDINFQRYPQVAPPVSRQYRGKNRVTKEDFIDRESNEGSLWASDGQTNYYFTKNKVRGVGDIVSVTMEDGLVRDVISEMQRSLTPQEQEIELAVAQQRLNQPAAITDGANTSQSGPNRAPASGGLGGEQGSGLKSAKASRDATVADINITPSVSLKAGEPFMTEIVQRYPNGNYKIRGTKRVPYRDGSRLVTLLAIVKGSDITDEDVVTSGKMYEYRAEVVR